MFNRKYSINEDNELILTTFYMEKEFSTINCGDIENILEKVKLYDEEYNHLIKENDYMNIIAKDWEKRKNEIERLNNIIDELENYLNNEQIEQGEYCDFLIKDKQIKVENVLNKLKELKERVD